MDTLIELYDERAIENIIGPETFKPNRVIYLCPIHPDGTRKKKEILVRFFRKRGLSFEIEFVETSEFKSDRIYEQLKSIYTRHKDLCIDITGGNDAILFAAGMFCQKYNVGAFTYSRKKNSFYNVLGAEFAEGIPCRLKYSVSEFFGMTGGTMRKGRVDNRILPSYLQYFEPFFNIFFKYRKHWNDDITFFQKISKIPKDQPITLKVRGNICQKGERGNTVYANKELIKSLERISFILNVKYFGDDEIAFEFKDENIRNWLRDVGSVLELYMYKICLDSRIFNDVVSSAIVDWEGYVAHDSVSNEIDVVAAKGIMPIFISCKACEVKTEALNELAVLRDRFGGKGAKACIVTTETCNAATRHRAAQLGIAVIDIEELSMGDALDRIKTIMKVRN